VWRHRLLALSELPDSTNEQITAAGRGFLNALHNDGTLVFPTPQFSVAEIYSRKKGNADQVPELIRQGQLSYDQLELHSDRSIEGDGGTDQDLSVKIEAADLLINAAKQLNKPEIARDAVAVLRNASPQNSYLKYSLWLLRARYAELEGRKLDALVLYRAASEHQLPGDTKGVKEVADAEQRLWKELGGSDASRDLWERGQDKAANPKGDWSKPTKTMSPWTLSDLYGHIWRLESLGGKVVLIDVWATWCGPCQEELPNLQRLYERVKDHPDIQIVTFNIDEEVGKVAPFVKTRGYTFPVLFAKGYLDDLHIEAAIPRNWIVDPHGKLLWEHLGFDPDLQWEAKILDKLSAAKASQ
jgi:thiol-disulfide isomerase/thioredoxin